MWWWCHHHIFLGISCFWGSRVYQKYAVWVLVGCGIKFHIQRALPPGIWVKTQGDMSKIRTKKVILFYDKYVDSTIMVDSFYWNSNSQKLLLERFLIRPILDPKFPLMILLTAITNRINDHTLQCVISFLDVTTNLSNYFFVNPSI